MVVCACGCVCRAVEQGVTQIDIEQFQELGVSGVLARVHEVIGDSPCYVSFDIDVLDPAFACGTVTLRLVEAVSCCMMMMITTH